MNGVIYYLLTSFTAKRKKTRPWSPPNKTLSRLTTTTDWPYQFVLAFKTVHYSAQHFLIFFVKQHHHRSRHWQQQQQIWDILIENQNNNKYSSSKCTYREDGVRAWPKTTGHAPPFTEIIRNWSKEHHHQPLLLQKHECNNDSFLLLNLNFFLISFVYKRECLPNRTKGMTTMT